MEDDIHLLFPRKDGGKEANREAAGAARHERDVMLSKADSAWALGRDSA